MATGGEGLIGIIVVAAGIAAVYGWFSDKSKKLKEDEFNRGLRQQLAEEKRQFDEKVSEDTRQFEQKVAQATRVLQQRAEHLASLRREFEAGLPSASGYH